MAASADQSRLTVDWLNNMSAGIATGAAIAPFVGWSLGDANLADGSLPSLLMGCAFWLFLAFMVHLVARRMVAP